MALVSAIFWSFSKGPPKRFFSYNLKGAAGATSTASSIIFSFVILAELPSEQRTRIKTKAQPFRSLQQKYNYCVRNILFRQFSFKRMCCMIQQFLSNFFAQRIEILLYHFLNEVVILKFGPRGNMAKDIIKFPSFQESISGPPYSSCTDSPRTHRFTRALQGCLALERVSAFGWIDGTFLESL